MNRCHWWNHQWGPWSVLQFTPKWSEPYQERVCARCGAVKVKQR